MANTTTQTREMAQQAKGMVERQAARLPSDAFMWAAGASILGSLTLKATGRHKDALFVGQWAPTFLLLGVISKLAKNFGSD